MLIYKILFKTLRKENILNNVQFLNIYNTNTVTHLLFHFYIFNIGKWLLILFCLYLFNIPISVFCTFSLFLSEYSFLKVLRVFHICFRSKSGVIFFSYTFLRYRADQERNIPIRYLHVRYQKGRKIISFARMTNVPLMKF